MAVTQILAALEPHDEAALAGFDHRYFGLVPFTTDRQKVLDAFDQIETFGSTGLHDALDKAAHDLASHGEGRRAVVVVTDGVDTASQNRPEDVIARSRALDVPIYAVTVVSPLDDPGLRALRGTGAAAGGRRERRAACSSATRTTRGAPRSSSATSAACARPPTGSRTS